MTSYFACQGSDGDFGADLDISCILSGVMRRSYKQAPVGARFGSLVVTGAVCRNGHWFWECLCDCGNTTSAQGATLESGERHSCGCTRARNLRARRLTHGYSCSATYTCWSQMIQRCTNPKNIGWSHYGGRGINVCERWRSSFVLFLHDMGERPPGMTIDRINVNGGYCPENCRWASIIEQRRNKRNTIYLMLDGKEESLMDAAERLGINAKSLRKRLALGWSHDDAVTRPLRKYKGN